MLLMDEFQNNHLGCIKPVVNNGINYQPQLVINGFLNHQQYSFHIPSIRLLRSFQEDSEWIHLILRHGQVILRPRHRLNAHVIRKQKKRHQPVRNLPDPAPKKLKWQWKIHHLSRCISH